MDIDAELKGNLSARYPTQFKKTVVRYAEKFNNREAERTFGIAESNIRRWRKLKPMLFSDGFFSDSDARKRGSAGCDEFLYVDGEASVGSPRETDRERESANVTKQQPDMPQKSNANENKPQDDEVCLRWNSHHHNMKSMFPILLQREQFVDVTLTSEGKIIKCHKLILSSCSTYFDNMLCDIPPSQHAIIFLNAVPFWLLKILVDFMYTGEVHIDQSKLQDLLGVAEMLQIKGLTGKSKEEEPPKEKPQKPVVANPKPTVVKPKVEQPKPPTKLEEIPESGKPTPNKKETKQPQQPLKLKVVKLQNADTMPLLKPIYMEDSSPTDPANRPRDSPKKVGVRKMKKRKSSEHEPVRRLKVAKKESSCHALAPFASLQSPPPILFRKGTKSRPHVKVPKYYHNDYEDLDSIGALNAATEKTEASGDGEHVAVCDLGKVKTEVVDVDDTEVLFTEVPEADGATAADDSNPPADDDEATEPNLIVDK